jgi:hypothetical protein
MHSDRCHVSGISDDVSPCESVNAPTNTFKAVKPKRRHEPMEARVISELRRHGIYW